LFTGPAAQRAAFSEEGEEIVIARDDEPVMRLLKVDQPKVRTEAQLLPGMFRGKVEIGPAAHQRRISPDLFFSGAVSNFSGTAITTGVLRIW